MSRRPAIGSDFVPCVAETLLKYPRWRNNGYDVPGALKYGKGFRPLGRVLHNKLRLACGQPKGAPQKYLDALREGFEPYFDVVEETMTFSEYVREPDVGPGSWDRVSRKLVGRAIGAGNRQLASNMLAKFRFRLRRQF